LDAELLPSVVLGDVAAKETKLAERGSNNGGSEGRSALDPLIRQGVITCRGVISYQVVQGFFNVARRRFADPNDTG
jgi:hypothetical protein